MQDARDHGTAVANNPHDRQVGWLPRQAHAIECSARNPGDAFPEFGTNATDVQPGHLRRGDAGTVGGIGRVHRQRHGEQGEHESGFGHARCGVQALRHQLTC